jgi:predicted ATPase
MLHVLTFRPEFEPPWPSRSHMTPLTLNRLERQQVEALIAHMAGGKALPIEVVEHIVTKTDGVPLYVEELTKMLLEADLLQEEVDQYSLTGPLTTVAIPETLQDSLMARLDQMHTAKETAQLGAVLGREFTYEMLESISSQDEKTLQAGLTQLVEAELLYQRGRPPRARYVFKHALIQDAAYASLLRSTRQQVHRQVVRALEEQFSSMAETQPELLAYHCTEAGLAEAAVDYWIKAGQHAHERSAHVEAIAHFHNGQKVLQTLPDNPQRIQRDIILHLALIEAFQVTKGYAAPEVADTYARLRALSHQITDTSQRFQLLWGLVAFHTVRGDAQTACELGEQLVDLTAHDSDAVRILVAHRCLGTALSLMGDFAQARQHIEQVITLYKAQPQHSSISRIRQDPATACLGHSTMILWLLGYPDQARQRSDEAIALAKKLAHPFSLGYALYYAAQLYLLRGERRGAQALAEELMSLSTKHAFTQFSVHATRVRTLALAVQRPPAETLTDMQHHLDHLRAIGEGQDLPPNLVLLAEAYGKSGNVKQGLELVAEALSVIDQTEARRSEAEAHRARGTLLLQQDVPDEQQAETCFHQALDVAREQQAKSLELRAATSLARLWQPQDKRQEAYDLLAPVYEWFTEGFDTADLQEAKRLLKVLA